MHRTWPLTSLLLAGAACGPALPEGPVEEPCAGMRLEVIDQAVAPPANVAARVRVTSCEGEPLPARLDPTSFLLAEDERVLSEFEAQRLIKPLDRDTVQLAVVALDLSGSVVRSGLRDEMVAGARGLVDALAPKHKVAIFGFDGRPDLIPFTYFTQDPIELHSALDVLVEAPLVDDSTNLHGAVINAVALLDEAIRIEAEKDRVAQGSLVIFTDGSDRAGRQTMSEATEAVSDSEHAAFTIGVGAEIDPATLETLGPDGHVVAGDASQLVGAFERVAALVKARAETDYLVSYCSPARAGAHLLEVRATSGERAGDVTIAFEADGFGAGCAPESAPLMR
ncbi:MAG: VWA domain-containing protein [Deltaproteobacteria bacterium]|nr:VWA domain-containing protein [Deltaproteobacteria bacterium]